MKSIIYKGYHVSKILNLKKKCDFCSNRASFDVPTKYGPWGNLCEHCIKYHADPAGTYIGYGLKGDIDDY